MLELMKRRHPRPTDGARNQAWPSHHPRHAASASGRRHDHACDLTEEISAAAHELFDCVDELHYSHDWPYDYAERRAFEAVRQARRVISRSDRISRSDLLEALMPVTYEWWPELSPLVAAARDAVERIRRAAIIAKYESGHDLPDSVAA